jgi:lipopolysaccharide/colanic/teichoic acid biosynthesis glycosyltransferase
MSIYMRGGKRALDIALSTLLLLAGAPVLLVAAIAVRTCLGAPVLHRSVRIGRSGQPFVLLKLRSMTLGDAPDAARLTRLGAWLRATSVDELPQLAQVVRGQMSLVGPRPLPVAYAPRLPPGRHAVRPGLTGPAQLAGRNALDWPARLALDMAYAARPRLLTDLMLLARTPLAILSARGVRTPGHAAGTPLPPHHG